MIPVIKATKGGGRFVKLIVTKPIGQVSFDKFHHKPMVVCCCGGHLKGTLAIYYRGFLMGLKHGLQAW